ncbi:MAG TPA: hypothetical protein DCQ93_02050, partial [Bacteroidetes bacterium]|nr:hypothetical protein [Bacteroidota bacterium]
SSGSFVGYTSPLAVTAVDFNGDGKTDLAIATQYRVRISLGDGAGNFSAPVDFGAGHPYYSITAAYINNDTALDLACAGGYMNCAWVFYGDGNGSFSAPQNVPADSNVIDVVCGDFNFDGSTDLVTADKSNDEISEFYGDGAGNFGAPVNFSVGDGPVAIAKANLDGNAFPDLVVVNQFACSVAVLQNNLGNFSQPQYFQLDSFPHDVVVADFNNDGLDDIAAVCNLTNLDSGSVNLLINCSSTEINETENKKTELVISPNPCFQDFSIKGLPFPNKIFEISIFNILGKKVFEKISVLPAEKFSVANFSPGIYLVKISTEENVYEQKIVVQ